jgi:anti-sigma B factor antagonist
MAAGDKRRARRRVVYGAAVSNDAPGNDLGDDVELTVTSRREGSRAIVEIGGELDLTALEPIRSRLRDAITEGVTTLELDVTKVSYVDSVALAMILAFQVNGPKEGVELRVVAASDEFARIVKLAGLEDALLPPSPAG